jgi:hypothetical protein
LGAVQFTAADDVKPAARFGQTSKNIDIAAGLDRIAHRRIDLSIGRLNLHEVIQKCRLAVNINRRTDLGRNF